MATVFTASSCLQSIHQLSGRDAKRALNFLIKLDKNPAQPGLSFERLEKINKNLWSARVSKQLRAIVYIVEDLYMPVHVGQHDAAYDWAQRHTVAPHPVTNELQVVPVPEDVLPSPQATPADYALPGIFDAHTDDYLLSLGVPPTWLPTLRTIQDDLLLCDVIQGLPHEVSSRLIDLATGEIVTPPEPVEERPAPGSRPPSGLRTFTIDPDLDVEQALEAPLESWMVFLHPRQESLAYQHHNGPIKVVGSAGTGKSVVALHRARFLAQQGKQVLLTTYLRNLCENLRHNLALLTSEEERRLITVRPLFEVAEDLLTTCGREVEPIVDADLDALIAECLGDQPCPLDLVSLQSEWRAVIRDQAIDSSEDYYNADRTGRGIGLSTTQRGQVWPIFQRVLDELRQRGQCDYPGLSRRAADALEAGEVTSPFDAVIVDELQDLGAQEFRFVKHLGGNGPDGLTLVGDPAQRIYARSFSMKQLGIQVVGRSYNLNINYRTTSQIRRLADRVLATVNGGRSAAVGNRQAVNLLAGPEPVVRGFASQADEAVYVAECCQGLIAEGLPPDAIGIFAPSAKLYEPVREALTALGVEYVTLRPSATQRDAAVRVGTIHGAKGLEFRAVFVMGVSEGRLPSRNVLDRLSDPADREDTITRFGNLLYVSMTRARDQLTVTWFGRPSPFLADVLEPGRIAGFVEEA